MDVWELLITHRNVKQKPYAWFNYLVCLGLILSLTFFSYLPSAFSKASRTPTPPLITELRGVWLTNVSSGVLFTPWGVNRALSRLSQLNFNTVYPVVWNRGHTFYPSRVAKQVTGKLEDPWLNFLRGGSDVLAEITKVGHRQHLSVIPWFEYGFIVPAYSTIAKQHPNWLTQSRDGQFTLAQHRTEEDYLKAAQSQTLNPVMRSLQSNYNRRVKQQVWLNPFHPEVQKFMQGLMTEIATNYDIDGIQLDDHFGLPVELGYDPFTVKLYQKEHHGKKPPQNPFNPEWMRWRANKLTQFMTQLVQAVKKINPKLKVSLSPNSYRFSYNNYLQDWQTWVARDLVDELVLQVYRGDLNSFKTELSQSIVQSARRKIPVSVGILTGTLNRPVDSKQIQQQIKVVRDRGFNGVSFFYWETLWGYLTPESPRQRRQVFRSIFAQPALRPKLGARV